MFPYNLYKTKLAAVLTALLICACLAGVVWSSPTPVAASSALALYVATDGNDNNPGTMAEPYATFVKARDRIREMKQNGGLPEGGVTVFVRSGEYRFADTFALGEIDSGTAEAPVVYRNYEGEEVRITGGATLDPSGFSVVADPAILARLPEEGREHVLQLDLGSQGIADYGQVRQHGFAQDIMPAPLELFVNDEAMTLARWPNTGTVPIGSVIDPGSIPRNGDYSNRGGTFTYTGSRPERWTAADGIILSGYFANGYAEDNIPVASINVVNKTLTLASPHLYGITTGQSWNNYYASNLLEEIDAPGEYFVDRSSGMLYLYPEGSLDKVQVSMLEAPMLALEGASYVTVQGLTFENSRGMGIYMERGSHNIIGGNTLRNLGTIAVSIGQGVRGPGYLVHDFTGIPESRIVGNLQGHIYQNQDWDRLGGTDHLVTGNRIYGMGAGGIFAGAGERRALVPGNLQIVNNEITRFNRRDKAYRPGIWLMGVGNRAAHNLIYDGPHMAIYLNGNDHVIEKNEIHDMVLHADDMGAIYMGRNPGEQGNVIRNNFFHHIGTPWEGAGTQSIFLDDGASGQLVEGNVFYQAGTNANFKVHGGHHNLFRNNISIDIPSAGYMQIWPSSQWMTFLNEAVQRTRLLNTVNIKQPPYSTRYPVLSAYYDQALTPQPQPVDNNVMENNVMVRAQTVMGGTATLLNNYATVEDPGFENADSMNFSLRPDSVVYQQLPQFTPIPFGEIGLQTDSYRPSWPVVLGEFQALAPQQGQGELNPQQPLLFNWEPSQGAMRYRLLVAEDAGFTRLVVDEMVAARSWMTAPGTLEYGTGYYWKVIAQSGSVSLPADKGNSNGVMSFNTEALAPVTQAPGALEAAQVSTGIQLTWEDVPYAVTYSVYRSSQSGSGFIRIAGTVGNTGFTDSGASLLEAQHYYIQGANGLGDGPPSAQVRVAPERAVLFDDYFTDGLSADWVVNGVVSGTRTVVEENGNRLLRFDGNAVNSVQRNFPRDVYAVESKFRVNSWKGSNKASQIVALTGSEAGNSRYQLMYRNSGVLQLEKRGAGAIREQNFTLETGRWYTFRMAVEQGVIRCYLDGTLLFEFTDSAPLPSGAFGLYAWNAVADFDDVSVYVPRWSSLPEPWVLRHYGPDPAYSAYEEGQFTLKAAGADVWGSSDEFGYIGQTVQSAGVKTVFEAVVESLTRADDNTMAGIMLRGRDTQDAANFYLRVKPNGEVFATVRSANGEPTTYKKSPALQFPIKLRVVRERNVFTGYFEQNGQWVKLEQVSLELPQEMLAGLAVSSRKSGAYAEAMFSGVALEQTELQLTPPVINSVMALRGEIALTWTGSEEAAGYRLVYGTQPGVYSSSLELGQVTSYILGGLDNGVTTYFQVVAVNGAKASASLEASATPSDSIVYKDAFSLIQAEGYDEMSGISKQSGHIGSADNGDWAGYHYVNFGAGASEFKVNVGVTEQNKGRHIEVRLDHPAGPLLGTLTVQSTGAYTNFMEQSVALQPVSGFHHVYLVFKGGYGVGNVDWFTFLPAEE
ncbi:MAG: hypothetical protein K0R57_1952 [Paenibacillaceae bacterium]|jgi:parallel beta-helix repeat protein|nr:hypothetical protein [Paenibacillaceae bacterium]